jgi:predicted nucleic acid-binding protein
MTLIVDASIAIKWVVQEVGSTEALALRAHGVLAAPDLFVAECATILWKKVARAELTLECATLSARVLSRSGVDLYPMHRLLEPALRIAVELNHPAYDCMYLALAMAIESRFVTADTRLLRVTAGRFDGRVVALEDA